MRKQDIAIASVGIIFAAGAVMVPVFANADPNSRSCAVAKAGEDTTAKSFNAALTVVNTGQKTLDADKAILDAAQTALTTFPPGTETTPATADEVVAFNKANTAFNLSSKNLADAKIKRDNLRKELDAAIAKRIKECAPVTTTTTTTTTTTKTAPPVINNNNTTINVPPALAPAPVIQPNVQLPVTH